MATIRWELAEHSRAKHEILHHYLKAWFGIIGKKPGKGAYIDAFCGPGQYASGEAGSPILALDAARSQPEGQFYFWLIDQSPNRIKSLNGLLEHYVKPKRLIVRSQVGTALDCLGSDLEGLNLNGMGGVPLFVFLDPFGYKGVPMALVTQLLAKKSSEVLINFMADSINRWLEHPEEAVTRNIVDAFGTTECLDIARRGGDRVEQLRLLYQRQLQRSARYVRFFEMRNQRNRPIYYLFFASNNKLGHVRMKEAMWKVDSTGAFRFSDHTNKDQLPLLDSPHGEILAPKLAARFRGKRGIPAELVRAFVESETEYLKKHMIDALQILEEQGAVTVNPIASDGSKRRRGRGAFKDTLLLSFGD